LDFGRIVDQRGGIGVGVVNYDDMGWRSVRSGNTRHSNRRGTNEHRAEEHKHT